MSYEDKRYDTIKSYRTSAVQEAYFYRAEALYKPRPHWVVDRGFSYAKISLPSGKFNSVEEALQAYRKKFNVKAPGNHPRLMLH